MSSANCFALDFDSLGKSLMQTRSRSGPKLEPQGTPAKTGFKDDVCPFKITLWNLPARYFSRRLQRSPEIPILLSL